MSLDVTLVETKPTRVYEGNITHNLNKMASAVKLSNGKSLYEVLWRPDENNYSCAQDIAELLDEAFNQLLAEPNFFRNYNPPNGWGSYEGLVNFVYNYRNACWDSPDAKIQVSR